MRGHSPQEVLSGQPRGRGGAAAELGACAGAAPRFHVRGGGTCLGAGSVSFLGIQPSWDFKEKGSWTEGLAVRVHAACTPASVHTHTDT